MSKSNDYILGYLEGLTRLLNHLNTYDTNMIDKKKLYREVLDWRPLNLSI